MMNREAELSCRCGAVHGRVTDMASNVANRIVCYCRDCQAFAHQLKRADLLDAHGGSDIVAVAPAAISFDRGREHIRGVRLSDKGLHRFYASCCNTPLGNVARPSIPFVGVPAQAFAATGPGGIDALLGPVRGRVYGQHAVGTPPEGSTSLQPTLLARIIWRIATWGLRGSGKPNPFFDSQTQQPLYALLVLSSAERDALRPLCGPRTA